MSPSPFLTFGADTGPMDSGPSSWHEFLTLTDSQTSIPPRSNNSPHAAWEEWWETANRIRRHRNGHNKI
jgi:hypothetical protein